MYRIAWAVFSPTICVIMHAVLISEYLCLDQLLSALKIWCWKPASFWLPCLMLKRKQLPSSLPTFHSGRRGDSGLQGRVREADCLKRMKNWNLTSSSQVRFKMERKRSAHSCRVLVSIVQILESLFIGKLWTRPSSGTSRHHVQQQNLVQQGALRASFCFPLSLRGSVAVGGEGKILVKNLFESHDAFH